MEASHWVKLQKNTYGSAISTFLYNELHFPITISDEQARAGPTWMTKVDDASAAAGSASRPDSSTTTSTTSQPRPVVQRRPQADGARRCKAPEVVDVVVDESGREADPPAAEASSTFVIQRGDTRLIVVHHRIANRPGHRRVAKQTGPSQVANRPGHRRVAKQTRPSRSRKTDRAIASR